MSRMKFEYFGASHPIDPFTGRPTLADLGTALNVGGSLLSGAMASDSASNAADASAKATAASNAMLQNQMGVNTASYSPYTTTGTAANSRLAELLGISPAYTPVSASSLTATDASGNFVPNADLYSKDPAYKAAFDKAVQDHYTSFHTDANISKGSDLSAFNQDVLRNYGGGLDAYNSAQQTASQNHSSDYGSLLKNFSASDLANDPVYNSGLQFGLDQGIQGLNRQAAAGGSLNSGSTLKALTKYANDYGSTKAQQAYNNFNTNKSNIYGMLSGQQGVGLNATNSLTGNNTNLLTGQASNTMANGQTQANADIASGAGWANAINGGIGNYLYQQRTANQAPANASISSAGGINNYASGNGMYSSGTPWYLKS